MNKWILGGALMLASFGAAAQQPTEQPRMNQMPMMGMMMQNCPMAGVMTGSVEVKYETTPGGATLVFTPKDPAKLSELQAKVREMAERMRKGEGLHDGHHPAK